MMMMMMMMMILMMMMNDDDDWALWGFNSHSASTHSHTAHQQVRFAKAGYNLQVQVHAHSGDPDIFVCNTVPRPRQGACKWQNDDASERSKVLIQRSDPNFTDGFYYIAVRGTSSSPSEFTLHTEPIPAAVTWKVSRLSQLSHSLATQQAGSRRHAPNEVKFATVGAGGCFGADEVRAHHRDHHPHHYHS
jgi:hypothetical protein